MEDSKLNYTAIWWCSPPGWRFSACSATGDLRYAERPMSKDLGWTQAQVTWDIP
jgi:hypothetical protein